MRKSSKNKMDAGERDERFPDTPKEGLRGRYRALARRRAKNKMARRSRNKNR